MAEWGVIRKILYKQSNEKKMKSKEKRGSEVERCKPAQKTGIIY